MPRWGYLQEADDFIEAQNLKPDARLWSSLLGACRIHGDDIRGQIAAEKLIALEPQNSRMRKSLNSLRYGPAKWSVIAQSLPGRIGKQCRERWHNHLNPDINN
ncbi:PREDICTED: pentatricopeptide repeat-containing protein At3g09040, mitochondrial-like [Camelina sativa]|uniref:Pentatricopeptide repeat-containing protein At3g09040, mitochondrial-like n=1 Tax=Camelina sativa TaxID=90675 RepID=A0ABM1QZH7_CAMSA|nr:PREDICTED: pentatricopeptide repeat-containing protein At3g09040, mitochondrial-like [Camelina sativa]